ncbi:MAG: hypothetical protein HY399_07540 [Elusimicrobia bacterium]|nr:hypothetical protein [Elusimicrobiota bacterium]
MKQERREKSVFPLIQLLFPLAFLLLAALILLPLMKGSVERLAGGGPDQSLSSTVNVPLGKNPLGQEGEEVTPAEKEPSQPSSGLHPDLARRAQSPGSGATGATQDSATHPKDQSAAGKNKDFAAGGSGIPGDFHSILKPKLQSRSSGLSSGGNSNTAFQKIDMGGLSFNKTGGRFGTASGGLVSRAMDALKNARKLSFAGAKQASLDSAQNWTARGFDQNPAGRTGLDYGKARSLDVMNPNSIPGFLRDDMGSLSRAKSLKIPDVQAPQVDPNAVDPVAQALKAAAEAAADKTTDSMDGFMGSLMGPFGDWLSSYLGGGGTPKIPDTAPKTDPGFIDSPLPGGGIDPGTIICGHDRGETC